MKRLQPVWFCEGIGVEGHNPGPPRLNRSEIVACREAEIFSRFKHRDPGIKRAESLDRAVRAPIIHDEGFEALKLLSTQGLHSAPKIVPAVEIDDDDREKRNVSGLGDDRS